MSVAEPIHYPVDNERSPLLASPRNAQARPMESPPPYYPSPNDPIKRREKPKYCRTFYWIVGIILTVLILVGILFSSIHSSQSLSPKERQMYRNSGIYWETAQPLNCLEDYHNRQFTARLQNFTPFKGLDINKACQSLDIKIQNHLYESPDECRQQGQHMYGYWTVYNPADCTIVDEIQKYRNSGIYWGATQPLNCLEEYHNREYVAQLHNFTHYEGFNINRACRSLDIKINNHLYESPNVCKQQGQQIYGYWTVYNQQDCTIDDEIQKYRNSGMSWNTPIPAPHCHSYDKREYKAELINIPRGYDLNKSCRYIPINIQDQAIEQPDVCERRGSKQYRSWLANSQLDCRPYWGQLRDLGCQASGKKRLEAPLWNLIKGDDRYAMCASTPARWNGKDYEHPTSCDYRREGMVGIWDVQEGCTTDDEIQKYRNSGMSWDTPIPAPHCHSYDKREYNAELINIPEGYDWNKACRYIPIDIQGQTIEQPDVCERRESRQYGKWFANNQMDCRTYWGPLNDVGCQESGKKRFEAPLWNLKEGDDWYGMCASTPAKWHGRDYEHPTNCDYRKRRGMIGIWDVEDCFDS